MTGLLDIAPERTAVKVQGHTLEVEGVAVRGIAELLRRFPTIRQLFDGSEAMDTIVSVAPDLVAAIIAAGCGQPGDRAYEEAAARLPAEAQSKLFGAILKLTLPSGIGPFVEGLATAFGGQPEAAPPTNSSHGRSKN
jgi:hypothetical protein